MPRLTKAQIATLSDDDLVQRATDAAKLHEELQEKQDECDCPFEREIIFKQRCKIRNLYGIYEDVLYNRYVDASRNSNDPEYIEYYKDLLITKIPPLYKITL